MTEELITQFHPSVHDAVAIWLRGLPNLGTPRVRAAARASRLDTINRFPAAALMAAYGISRWRAADAGLCEQPEWKFGLKPRWGKGVRLETPAHRLRVKVGRKFITVYAAPAEETKEKPAL